MADDKFGIFKDMTGKRRLLLGVKEMHEHNLNIPKESDRKYRNDMEAFAKEWHKSHVRNAVSVSVPSSMGSL